MRKGRKWGILHLITIIRVLLWLNNGYELNDEEFMGCAEKGAWVKRPLRQKH